MSLLTIKKQITPNMKIKEIDDLKGSNSNIEIWWFDNTQEFELYNMWWILCQDGDY